uniref:Uncharacterized protein n=1 Tax=Parascaris equorum TaxID=6256 RepID=A0A914RU59_PAREQ
MTNDITCAVSVIARFVAGLGNAGTDAMPTVDEQRSPIAITSERGRDKFITAISIDEYFPAKGKKSKLFFKGLYLS